MSALTHSIGPAAVREPVHQASLTRSTLVIARRTLLRHVRTPQLIVVGIVQMLMFFFMYRYLFGGAIHIPGMSYVDFMAPGFIATASLYTGVGTAVAIAEDQNEGFIDRLRSLPMPRSAVLLGRAAADTILITGYALFGVGLAFALGFRLHGSALSALAALVGVVVFAFAFEWLFVMMGLFASNGQAAQGMGMIVYPFIFISSAYVPVATMPGWLQTFANHQPLTYMVDAVRSLTLGSHSQALLGHQDSHYFLAALLSALLIVAIAMPLAVARYRRG